jgi:myo-inositol-1-phosphate synthase
MSEYRETRHIRRPEGKLAVLIPGLGAVGTTFIAGTMAVRNGIADPVGSLTQLGRLPTRGGDEAMTDAVPLARLDDLVFGGWDIFDVNVYEAAKHARVLDDRHLEPIRAELEAIRPMRGVFDRDYVRNLDGEHIKQYDTKMDAARMLMTDIAAFMDENNCSRAVAVWCGSTEVHVDLDDVHMSLDAFEDGLRDSHPAISPTMIYAYAHFKLGVPFINGAPNRALDTPALVELADREGVPFAGKDFKTGQTLLKTILAPGFAARRIGIRGWYSTNILGNRDGEVLDDPGSFKTKEESKLSVLDAILDPDNNRELYDNFHHKVRIDYYPPRGDNKEGWDNIDIFGWLGYEMQIKIDFLCRDSILAAPLVLDLALWADLAARSELAGNQEWLSFYFKSPQTRDGEVAEHDLFAQREMLFAQVRRIRELAQADEKNQPWKISADKPMGRGDKLSVDPATRLTHLAHHSRVEGSSGE